MTPRQQALSEALGNIAAVVPLDTDQTVRVSAILDRLYEQAEREGEKS